MKEFAYHVQVHIDLDTLYNTSTSAKSGSHMIAVGNVDGHGSICNHEDVLVQGHIANATVGTGPIWLQLEVLANFKGPSWVTEVDQLKGLWKHAK